MISIAQLKHQLAFRCLPTAGPTDLLPQQLHARRERKREMIILANKYICDYIKRKGNAQFIWSSPLSVIYRHLEV